MIRHFFIKARRHELPAVAETGYRVMEQTGSVGAIPTGGEEFGLVYSAERRNERTRQPVIRWFFLEPDRGIERNDPAGYLTRAEAASELLSRTIGRDPADLTPSEATTIDRAIAKGLGR